MPPKKKGSKPVKAVVKKKAAPAKRPVGRPRKELGTRVSDSNVLANVGSTKPMPRRIGRDALEQQRARLRFARDYPGQRFTEQMTRALQDSFATGTLPYGVSLRAAEPFARKYKTSFAPIAGMPVWPASQTFPTGPPGRGPPLRRSIASGPGPGPGPGKDAGILDDLEDLLDEEARPTSRQSSARTSLQSARQISSRRAVEVKKELAELSKRGNSTADTRESIRSLLASTPTSGRSSVSSSESATGRISDDQIKKLEAAMRRLVRKEAEAAQAEAEAAKEEPRLVTNRPQRPQQTLSSISGMQDEIARLQQSVENANRALAQPRPRSSADVERLVRERDENIERIRYLLGSIDTSPPAQQMVVSVPDPVSVNDELSMLKEREAVLRRQLSLQRAGRSLAGARRELEYVLGQQQQLLNETASATPSSDPASASGPAHVHQSIPVPGTETQVPLPSDQEMVPFSYVQGMMDAQERLLDRLSIADRVAKASAPPLLDLRQNPKNEDEYSSRALQFITPKGKIALEARTEQTGRDIEREAAELVVPGTRLKKLLEAIQSKVKPDIINEEKIKFAREAEEAAEAQKLIAQSEKARKEGTKGPAVADMRRVAKHVFMPPSAARRLNEEADLRVEKSSAVLSEPAETVPGISTGIDDLELPTNILREMAASREFLPGTLARIDAELARREENEQALRDVLDLSQSATIPPPSNPPEPRGDGLQHVTAATFPASKWTTASSLRWLRSNGLHPIRKSTKINGAYSYALQSPVSYSSFNSVKMSHKNKDFTIVYGTPK